MAKKRNKNNNQNTMNSQNTTLFNNLEKVNLEIEELKSKKNNITTEMDSLNKEIDNLITIKGSIEETFNSPIVIFMKTILQNKNKEDDLKKREDLISKKELQLNKSKLELDKKNEDLKIFKEGFEAKTKAELYKLVELQKEETLKNTELFTKLSKMHQENILKFD